MHFFYKKKKKIWKFIFIFVLSSWIFCVIYYLNFIINIKNKNKNYYVWILNHTIWLS